MAPTMVSLVNDLTAQSCAQDEVRSLSPKLKQPASSKSQMTTTSFSTNSHTPDYPEYVTTSPTMNRSIIPWHAHRDIPPVSSRTDDYEPQRAHQNPREAPDMPLSHFNQLQFPSRGLPPGRSYQMSLLGQSDESTYPRTYMDPNTACSLNVFPDSSSFPMTTYEMVPPSFDFNAYLSHQVSMDDSGVSEGYNTPMSSCSDYEYTADSMAAHRSMTSTPLQSIEPAHFVSPLSRLYLDPRHDRECTASSTEVNEPYAKLIYRALMGAPDQTMILKEIYEWFRQNTDKATNKETKGWQNSIRHNLSMNGAFRKVLQSPTLEAKKGFKWRLTEDAIANGVKSTTRYRSKIPNKRGNRTTATMAARQASGARGGHASRRSANRRSQRIAEAYRSGRKYVNGMPAGTSGIRWESESPADSEWSMNTGRHTSPYFVNPDMTSTGFMQQMPPSFQIGAGGHLPQSDDLDTTFTGAPHLENPAHAVSPWVYDGDGESASNDSSDEGVANGFALNSDSPMFYDESDSEPLEGWVRIIQGSGRQDYNNYLL